MARDREKKKDDGDLYLVRGQRYFDLIHNAHSIDFHVQRSLSLSVRTGDTS